jgi:hypothetical protein
MMQMQSIVGSCHHFGQSFTETRVWTTKVFHASRQTASGKEAIKNDG